MTQELSVLDDVIEFLFIGSLLWIFRLRESKCGAPA